MTDALGRFTFANLFPGPYRLPLTSPGYQVEREVEVQPDALTNIASSYSHKDARRKESASMAEYLAPGVYVEEIDLGGPSRA